MKKIRIIFGSLFSSHKAQLTLFFISIIVLLIIITMVTINIGKIAKDRTYTENSTDAGALAGASVCAYAFNYVAEANKDDEDNHMEDNYSDFQDAVSGGRDAPTGVPERGGPYFRHTYQQVVDSKDDADRAVSGTACCGTVCNGPTLVNEVIREVNMFKQNTQSLDNVIRDYYETQQQFYEEIRETVHDDAAGQNDLYNNALSVCYRFNLYNSGFPVKMGEDAKEFYEWVDSLTPGSIQNCTPETYTWTDGAGRSHLVTATCCIDPIHTYEVNITQNDRQTTHDLLSQARTIADTAIQQAQMASGLYSAGCAVCPCTTLCTPPEQAADAILKQGGPFQQTMDQARNITQQAEEGVRNESPQTSNSKTDLNDKIIAYLEDITHSRTVTDYQFQFHMGGVVKGPRGDIDAPTFYPPVQAGATASFAGGSIHPQESTHEARLISSW